MRLSSMLEVDKREGSVNHKMKRLLFLRFRHFQENRPILCVCVCVCLCVFVFECGYYCYY